MDDDEGVDDEGVDVGIMPDMPLQATWYSEDAGLRSVLSQAQCDRAKIPRSPAARTGRNPGRSPRCRTLGRLLLRCNRAATAGLYAGGAVKAAAPGIGGAGCTWRQAVTPSSPACALQMPDSRLRAQMQAGREGRLSPAVISGRQSALRFASAATFFHLSDSAFTNSANLSAEPSICPSIRGSTTFSRNSAEANTS